ncbi:MAG: dialkylresorcinol condensing enzyme [Thermodesulfobacteriota bacterium]
MKNILLIYYTQSGQLFEIARSLTKPLSDNPDINLDLVNVEPLIPYPFPWPFLRFFDVLAESVLMVAPEMKSFQINKGSTYDLILLCYTVWFLSPSLPITGFLKSSDARIMQGVPVITIVNARDKWVTAQEQVKRWIDHHGGRLVGHIAVIPDTPALAGLVTTLRWLWAGKKKGFWRFPDAGVPKAQIDGLERFGRLIRDGLMDGSIDKGLPVLEGYDSAAIDPDLVRQERVGYRVFQFWARAIHSCGPPGDWKRLPIIAFFMIILGTLIALSFPIGMVLKFIVNPLRKSLLIKNSS